MLKIFSCNFDRRFRRLICLLITLIAVSPLVAAQRLAPASQHIDTPADCSELVGLLLPDADYDVVASKQPRVELYRCSQNNGANIRIVAWEAGARKASLTVDSYQLAVVQTAARHNIFVVETGGGSRNEVVIIVFRAGRPQLVAQQRTKGTAELRVSESAFDVKIVGIWAGDAPERVKEYHFSPDIDELSHRERR